MTDCLSSVKSWDPVGMTQETGSGSKAGVWNHSETSLLTCLAGGMGYWLRPKRQLQKCA